MAEKNILDFSGGLNVDKDKSRVLPNEFVNDSNNGVPQEDGSIKKRSGKIRNWKVDSTPGNISGLIQNETEDEVKELYTIVNGKLYKKTDETTSEELMPSLSQVPFYSEYWQNQVFWGNGIEDIIALKSGLLNRKFYVSDNQNYRMQIFEKSSNHKFLNQFGTKGTGDSEFNGLYHVAVDIDRLYVVDRVNKRVQIFDRNGIFIDKFPVELEPTGIDVDEKYIYVTGEYGTYSILLRKYLKSSPYTLIDSYNSPGHVNFLDVSVDEDWVHVTVHPPAPGNDGILSFSKLFTFNEFSPGEHLINNGILKGIYVERDTIHITNYIYVADQNVDGILVYNKSFSLITTLGSSGSGDGELDQPFDIISDKDYVYITDSVNSRIVIFNKSDWSFKENVGSPGALGGQFNLPVGIAGDYLNQNDKKYLLGFLDSPSAPLIYRGDRSLINNGTYTYKISFSDGSNETNISNESTNIVITDNNQIVVNLLDVVIPANITKWVIYRKKDSGNYYQLTIIDINIKTYIDDIPEADIINNSSYSTHSTIYPFLDSNIFTFFREALWIIEGKFLYYSAPYQPYYFPSTNVLELDTRTDGSAIYGSESGMYIFTKNSLSLLEGWSIENYFFREISTSVGCVSHRSIQEYLKALIFLDRKGIFVTTGGDPIKISSERIDNLIKTIQTSKYKYINSVIYDDKYILSVPIGDNDYCDTVIMYDFKIKCFYIFKNWIIQDMTLIETDDDELKLYAGSNDSGVYELFNGSSDVDIDGNNNDISMIIETKHYDEGTPLFLKLIRSITAYTKGVAGSTYTFKWQVGDNALESKGINITNTNKIAKRFRPLSGRGTKFYLRIEESSQNEFDIFGFSTDTEILSKMDINK